MSIIQYTMYLLCLLTSKNKVIKRNVWKIISITLDLLDYKNFNLEYNKSLCIILGTENYSSHLSKCV